MSTSAGLLLDLGVLAQIRSGSPDPALVRFLQLNRHQRVFISALTLCELAGQPDAGPARDPAAAGEPPETDWLQELSERFADNILPVDTRVALACQAAGPRIPAVIAATARCHNLTVVSTDTADYERLGVAVVAPARVAESV